MFFTRLPPTSTTGSQKVLFIVVLNCAKNFHLWYCQGTQWPLQYCNHHFTYKKKGSKITHLPKVTTVGFGYGFSGLPQSPSPPSFLHEIPNQSFSTTQASKRILETRQTNFIDIRKRAIEQWLNREETRNYTACNPLTFLESRAFHRRLIKMTPWSSNTPRI